MFEIFVKDTKILLRDRTWVFFMLLFPTIMVFLLGNLLASQDNPDSTVGTLSVQYAVETQDPVALAALEPFLDELQNTEGLDFQETGDIESAKALAGDGTIAAAVLFRQPLSIEIYTGGDDIKNRAVDSIFKSFSQQSGVVYALIQTAPQALSSPDALLPGGEELVQQKDLGINRSMLDYYAITMTVMILLMGGATMATTFQDERKGRTLARMMASPKNRSIIYIQKVLGSLPMLIVQVLVIMLASTQLLGAHLAPVWEHNLLLFAMFFLLGTTSIAFFSIAGILLKVNAMLALMPVIWVVLFVSGSFSKEFIVAGITENSPITMLQSAVFDMTLFGRTDKVLMAMAVCAIILVVSVCIGSFLFRRKEVSA